MTPHQQKQSTWATEKKKRPHFPLMPSCLIRILIMAHHNPHYNWVVLHPPFFSPKQPTTGPLFWLAHIKKKLHQVRGSVLFQSPRLSWWLPLTHPPAYSSWSPEVGRTTIFVTVSSPSFLGNQKEHKGKKKTICIAESIKEKLTHLFWSTKFWRVLGWNHLEFAQSSDLKHWIPTVILKKKHQGLCFIERSQAGTDDCFHSCYPTSYYQLERQIKTSKKHLQSPSLPGKKTKQQNTKCSR